MELGVPLDAVRGESTEVDPVAEAVTLHLHLVRARHHGKRSVRFLDGVQRDPDADASVVRPEGEVEGVLMEGMLGRRDAGRLVDEHQKEGEKVVADQAGDGIEHLRETQGLGEQGIEAIGVDDLPHRVLGILGERSLALGIRDVLNHAVLGCLGSVAQRDGASALAIRLHLFVAEDPGHDDVAMLLVAFDLFPAEAAQDEVLLDGSLLMGGGRRQEPAPPVACVDQALAALRVAFVPAFFPAARTSLASFST